MAFVDSILVFLVSLGIGALGLHIGALFIVGESDYRNAIVTAILGAFIWSIVGFFFGWIPLLGPGLTFIAWLGVIKGRYPGDWMEAAAIAFVAWISVLAVLYVLAAFGLGSFEAIGMPLV